jgi:hypothetical protein
MKERIRFCDANNKKTVEGRIVFRYTTYINSRTKLPAITTDVLLHRNHQ